MIRSLILLAIVTSVAGPATAIDPDALEALRAAAEAAHSDAVFIQQGDEVVADWTFGEERRPIEIMSVLKSVVAIGVGRLLELGHLDSLDQPVHTLYPEWKQGRKQAITVRHLLNHTSGLQNEPNAGAEIYPAPDAVRLALAAELSSDPGAEFHYNNKAVNLLSGVIERASGQRMDQFLVAELFTPLGIEEYVWYYDRSGTPHAMAGLRLLAPDLAKLGRLVLEGGVREGERLVGADFLDAMLAEGQPHLPRCGLLWWRLLDEDQPVAYYGDGYLGQTLMIVPAHDLVAVRQVRSDPTYDPATDGFGEFRRLVLDLVTDRP